MPTRTHEIQKYLVPHVLNYDFKIPASKIHIEQEMTTKTLNTDGKLIRKGLTPDITVDGTKKYTSFVVEIETDPSNVQIKEQRFDKVNMKVLFIEPKKNSSMEEMKTPIGFIITDIKLQLEAQIHKVDRNELRSKAAAEYRLECTRRFKGEGRR